MNNIKYLLIVFGFITVFESTAQSLGTTSSKHFEIGSYYPMILGDNDGNTYNTFYNGVLGLDLKYTFKKLPLVNLKIGSGLDYFSFESNVRSGNTIRLNPNLIAGVNLSKVTRIEPYIGVGYSFIFDNNSFNDNAPDILISPDGGFYGVNNSNQSDVSNHLFYKLGVNYKILKIFYIDVHAYMVRLFKDSGLTINTSKQFVLNIGIGIQF